MTKSKFSEHQIINILKQTQNGRTVSEVCRENSMREFNLFQVENQIWRSGKRLI